MSTVEFCVEFSEAMGSGIYCRGESLRIRVGRLDDLDAAWERTFSMGNNIYWQGFVGYSITMAKRFLNNIIML